MFWTHTRGTVCDRLELGFKGELTRFTAGGFSHKVGLMAAAGFFFIFSQFFVLNTTVGIVGSLLGLGGIPVPKPIQMFAVPVLAVLEEIFFLCENRYF